MITLPRYISLQLFDAACAHAPRLRHIWQEAITAGRESSSTQAATISIACDLLAHAKFIKESEDQWCRERVQELCGRIKSDAQFELVAAILAADRNNCDGRWNSLVATDTLNSRLSHIDLSTNSLRDWGTSDT
jgi:hypothetical protein